jgi:hypothetical protein
MKLMRMTQTTAKYPKYDDNIMEATKSTETKTSFERQCKTNPFQQDKTRFWNLKKMQSK